MLHLDIAEKQKPGNPRCAFVVRADDSAPPWLLHLHLHLRPLLHLRPFPFLLLRLLLRLRLRPFPFLRPLGRGRRRAGHQSEDTRGRPST
ncbi:MAG: hypothetical protein WCF36_21350, partial [Candidatus Nanopelagicales bacterium]